MATLTDSRYVQKSKLFLLPLIELKKDQYIKPKGPYIMDKQKRITTADYKLIVPFDKEDSSEFNHYETNYILTSSCLDSNEYYETDNLRIYVFDLDHFKEDFDVFLKGKYTDLHTKTKGFINLYWGTEYYGKFSPHPKIEAYLAPTLSTYERFADELKIPLGDLLRIGQLLDPPDLEKETFISDNFKHTKVNETELES